MSTILHIHLLGTCRMVYVETPVTSVHTDRLQSLLALPVLHRDRPQPRRQIAALLWPELPEAQGRSNLRNLLFHLRRALPDPDRVLVADMTSVHRRISDQNAYRLTSSPSWRKR